ncbi:MAG: hypothetical protein QXP81_06285 [Nitrososphaerota archaeon]
MTDLNGLRQRLITEFVFVPANTGPRAQVTLDGLLIPVRSAEHKAKTDRNTRLFHFYIDPSPVLTISRARVIKTDGRLKIRLDPKLLSEIIRERRIEIRHFGLIKEVHSANIDSNKLRVNLGPFYSCFYNSGETVLVKQEGNRIYLVTKVGEHPLPYVQFMLVSYRQHPHGRETVQTTRGFILPKRFYEQAEKEFPSVVEITGKVKRVKEARREKRYVCVPDEAGMETLSTGPDGDLSSA